MTPPDVEQSDRYTTTQYPPTTHAWRKDVRHPAKCPHCGSRKSLTRFLNWPGRFVCHSCHRAYTDESLVVPRWVKNPECE